MFAQGREKKGQDCPHTNDIQIFTLKASHLLTYLHIFVCVISNVFYNIDNFKCYISKIH